MAIDYKTFGTNIVGFIGDASDGYDMSSNTTTYFCDITIASVLVNAPDPNLMAGKMIIFYMTNLSEESNLTVAGYIDGSDIGTISFTSFTTMGCLISDGIYWRTHTF